MTPHNTVAELARSFQPADERDVIRPLVRGAEASGLSAERAERLVRRGIRGAVGRVLQSCLAVAKAPGPGSLYVQAAEVQDADHVAAKMYSRFTSLMGSREGAVWREIGDFARAARVGALQAFAASSDPNAGEDGAVARAVFGQFAGEMISRVPGVHVTGQTGRMLAGTLPESAAAGFTPIIVGGPAFFDLVDGGSWAKDAPTLNLTARLFVFLRSIDGTSVARARPHDLATERMLAGRFDIEQGRDGILKARVLIGNDYLWAPVVPLGVFHLRHARLSDLRDAGDYESVLRALTKARYQTVKASTKKSEVTGRTVGVSNGYIKWARPDPFAAEKKS